MIKNPSNRLWLAALLLSPALASAQVQEQEYEIRNACKATSRLHTPADASAELEIRVEDANNPQHGFGTFKKLVKTDGALIPLRGFNLCDSFSHGPVAVTVETSGDYQRISMTCGGTWQPVDGSATVTIQVSTGKAVYARVKLDGAYGNGRWHTGFIKSQLEAFTCAGSTYEVDVVPLFTKKDASTVKGTISKEAFTKSS
jgi:hypothetical protein